MENTPYQVVENRISFSNLFASILSFCRDKHDTANGWLANVKRCQKCKNHNQTIRALMNRTGKATTAVLTRTHQNKMINKRISCDSNLFLQWHISQDH